jgi:hypothetical protein
VYLRRVFMEKDNYEFFKTISNLGGCLINKDFVFTEDEFLYFHNEYKDWVSKSNEGIKAFYGTVWFVYLVYKIPSEKFIIDNINDIDLPHLNWEKYTRENKYHSLRKILKKKGIIKEEL